MTVASPTSHNNAHPDRPVLSDDGLFDLPSGWVWTTLGSVLTHLVDCVNDTPDFVDEDTGYLGLKPTNVRPYQLDVSRKWHVTAADFERWNRREVPVAGDILLTREAPVGFACIVPTAIKACITQRLMLLRAHTVVVEPMWILHYLNGPHFRQQIEKHSRGLTTPHIRVQDAPNFLLPLPPIETQREILQRLSAIVSFPKWVDSSDPTLTIVSAG
jgi:type I restriction enzyme S subunit